MAYVSLPELKKYVNVKDTQDDVLLTSAIKAAERAVDARCGRYFSQDAAVSARQFEVCGPIAWVDDISTTTGLVIQTDVGADGTYAQTWATTDYQLEPLNQIVDGLTGWPYEKIRARGYSYWFPTRGYGYPGLQVTARWGWPDVPEAVRAATRMFAAELFRQKDAPFGVAGFDSFGAVRIRDNPTIETLLGPFVK